MKQSSSASAEIYWMAVDPECHRSGIGRALVEAAVEAVRTQGVTYLIIGAFGAGRGDHSVELADILALPHHDTDDYFGQPITPPESGWWPSFPVFGR